MKQVYVSIGLGRLCRLFGKSRQAFYDHANRRSNDRLQEALIAELVKSVRIKLPRIGGLKLLCILKTDFEAHNIGIGRDRFFRLLREYNLLVKPGKRYIRTTQSNHYFKKWTNLLTDLKLTAVQQLWVSDITYLSTQNGFVYLSLITDAYSRKIVGYHLSQQLKAKGCLIALHKALRSLDGGYTLVHHSDRGIQYCCEEYVETLQQYQVQISMTQSGSPYENAVAERVNGILKTELGLNQTFDSYNKAVDAVHQAIDAYNRLRPHMSCANLTPELAHRHTGNLTKKWKPKTYCKPKSVSL